MFVIEGFHCIQFFIVTHHFITVDQMKKMESGFVCEVLHFLLKKSSRYGTPLVKFPVDLVEMDNEASLDLLRALFKHSEYEYMGVGKGGGGGGVGRF